MCQRRKKKRKRQQRNCTQVKRYTPGISGEIYDKSLFKRLCSIRSMTVLVSIMEGCALNSLTLEEKKT